MVVEPFSCKSQPARGFSAVAGIAIERGADQRCRNAGYSTALSPAAIGRAKVDHRASVML
jgi:hypothetical protein